MSISRRKFLETTAAGALAASSLPAAKSGSDMPTRVLGKTGVKVSILAFGSGSRFLKYDDEQGVEAAKKAMDLGINYFDSADDYGKDHRSEKMIGQAIKGRRDSLFLATKLSNRDPQKSFEIIEGSLKAFGTDHLDLLHIHSLLLEDDLDKIEAKGGVLDQVLKMRDQKMVKYIGITSHTDPATLAKALERHDFDVTQMALNGALVGMKNGKGGMVPNDAIKTSFETIALPVANKKKMGVIAMKVMAQDALIGPAQPGKLMYYSLSLPVTAVVIGMPKFEHVEENCQLAKAFKPLAKSEMKELSGELSKKYKAQLDQFFSNHVDA
jgi:predicted aldo/keto reductase-like oxidoreductase